MELLDTAFKRRSIERTGARLAALVDPGALEYGRSARVSTSHELVGDVSLPAPRQAEAPEVQIRRAPQVVALWACRSAGPGGSRPRSSIWGDEGESCRLLFHPKPSKDETARSDGG
ncbi:MAG: hypothetical protein AAF713_10825 [Pseudomonadota bacterium]